MDEKELRRLWEMHPAEMPTPEIARRAGLSTSGLWLLRKRAGLPRRKRTSWKFGKERHVDAALLFRLWHQDPLDMPIDEIARQLGVGQSTVYKHAKRHKLPRRNARTVIEPSGKKRTELYYPSLVVDPTPEEIAERARECRERHFAKRRSEDEHTTRKKIWLEETQCRRTSSQSRA